MRANGGWYFKMVTTLSLVFVRRGGGWRLPGRKWEPAACSVRTKERRIRPTRLSNCPWRPFRNCWRPKLWLVARPSLLVVLGRGSVAVTDKLISVHSLICQLWAHNTGLAELENSSLLKIRCWGLQPLTGNKRYESARMYTVGSLWKKDRWKCSKKLFFNIRLCHNIITTQRVIQNSRATKPYRSSTVRFKFFH